MRRFRFDKLVRNLIVKQQLASGAKPRCRQLSLAEHKRKLVEKMIEEARELLQATPAEISQESKKQKTTRMVLSLKGFLSNMLRLTRVTNGLITTFKMPTATQR